MAAAGPSAKRIYYHLFVAQLLALISTGLATVALAFLAYDLAGEDAGAVLGTALAIKMSAYVLIAPIAAAIVVHLPRRALLVGLDLVRAVIALALPFVTAIWEVYLLIFAFQAASAVFTPTYQATIPELLPGEKDYTLALSRSRLAHELEGVVSPVLAAALLTVISSEGLFVATFAGFLVSAGLILAVTLPSPQPTADQGGLYAGTTRGLRIFMAYRPLRGLLALNLAIAAAAAMATVNTVVLVQVEFGLGERATTIALAVFGAGSVMAALLVPRLVDRLADRTTMLVGAGLLTGGLLLGVFLTSYLPLLPLWFGLGFGCALAMTPAGALLRRAAGPGDRPALYAAQFALSNACLMVTYPLAGWLGASFGLPFTFVALGLLATAAVFLAWQLWRHPDPDYAAEAGRVCL